VSEGPAGLLPVAGRGEVRRAAGRLVWVDRWAFAAMVGVNGVAAVLGLAPPWLVGRIVDGVRGGAGVGAVDRYGVLLVACAVGQLLAVRFARLVAYRFGERASARVRERFVERALALPAAVVERAGTGDLAARGTGDVAAVGVTLRGVGPDVAVAAAEAAVLLVVVLLLDPRLGVCGLLTLVGCAVAARWYLRRARPAYLAEGATGSVLTEVLATTAAGARTVAAFGLERRRIEAGEDAIAANRAARLRTLFLRSVLFPSVDLSFTVPVVVVLVAGAVLHAERAVSLGTVVAAALYLRQLAQPLDMILQWVEQLQSSGASFARVEGLATAPRPAAAKVAEPAGDGIEIRGLRYGYDGGPEVLHGIDLTVRPGERLAVVGPSGAGKTTLGRLLAGLERPRAGTVTVGGVPLADLPPDRLRRQVVLVTQEHHVFLGTLRDNLLLAAPGATDADLLAALRVAGAGQPAAPAAAEATGGVAGAGWLAALPSGLDTRLGPDAQRLDGAQAQQLALARVVLADPHTLILDEATALLDPTTARATERSLAAVLRGRTVIAVAHRLHTAHHADRIAVMDAGRLVELGTHDELVAAGGRYAALWRSWHG
jgi:ATP-binding cassette subfamily C protein